RFQGRNNDRSFIHCCGCVCSYCCAIAPLSLPFSSSPLSSIIRQVDPPRSQLGQNTKAFWLSLFSILFLHYSRIFQCTNSGSSLLILVSCPRVERFSLPRWRQTLPACCMKEIGYRVFPSRHSESIRRSKSLFHYELPTARRAVIECDYRQYVAPKISHSDYKVTSVPSRVLDEPDYDRDEEERLSGKGTPDRHLSLSRPPSSSSLDRPPHRTNAISAAPSPASLGGGMAENHDTVERRSTAASSNVSINNGTGERRNTGYYMERERFNGMHGRSHALESMERDTYNGLHGRSSAIATNSVDRPQHAATYHPASNSSSHRHTGSSVSVNEAEPALVSHRSIKIRDGFDRHPEVRDVIDQSEEILEDLDSMLEEHLSFDEARRKIMDKNLSFRQYSKMPYDDENNYEIIEEIYERRI
ncbi:hypothetical protein PMAYCL1PPCAC_04517, partial [Pristionchus mayeri]